MLLVQPRCFHSCGVKLDGSVVCWGDNQYGQSSPPAGAFSSVVAGYSHTCGVTFDGGVRCWGDNKYEQSTCGGLYTPLIGP